MQRLIVKIRPYCFKGRCLKLLIINKSASCFFVTGFQWKSWLSLAAELCKFFTILLSFNKHLHYKSLGSNCFAFSWLLHFWKFERWEPWTKRSGECGCGKVFRWLNAIVPTLKNCRQSFEMFQSRILTYTGTKTPGIWTERALYKLLKYLYELCFWKLSLLYSQLYFSLHINTSLPDWSWRGNKKYA